jgi:hypothetical protein
MLDGPFFNKNYTRFNAYVNVGLYLKDFSPAFTFLEFVPNEFVNLLPFFTKVKIRIY